MDGRDGMKMIEISFCYRTLPSLIRDFHSPGEALPPRFGRSRKQLV